MRSIVTGFLTGFPLMIVIGPVAVLLMETGLGHGMRRGWRAAGGVAAADTVFAIAALLGGRVIARVLVQWETMLHLVGAVVLAAIAAHMLSGALVALRSADSVPVAVAGGERMGSTLVVAPQRSLAPRFFLISIANPMTIMAFATIVLASGQTIAGPGWVAGVALASFVAHSSFVGAGAGLGSVVTSPRRLATVRIVGVLVVLALAAHFAIA